MQNISPLFLERELIVSMRHLSFVGLVAAREYMRMQVSIRDYVALEILRTLPWKTRHVRERKSRDKLSV